MPFMETITVKSPTGLTDSPLVQGERGHAVHGPFHLLRRALFHPCTAHRPQVGIMMIIIINTVRARFTLALRIVLTGVAK